MTTLDSLCDRTLADPLAAARGAAAGGRRVVGLVGIDTPVELVLAAGAMPLQLPAPPLPATPRADQFFEPCFMPAHRSIAEQWLAGDFDFIDTVVFTRGDDSAQRLYYYLCELQRTGLTGGPKPLLYDVARIPRTSSNAHTVLATRRLAQALGSVTASLPGAIVDAEKRRTLLARLQAWRDGPQAPDGIACTRAALAAGRADRDDFDRALAQWLDVKPTPWHGARLLLAGSVPPDATLHAAAAAAGGRIVREFGDHSLLAPPVPAGEDPLSGLAMRAARLPAGPRSFHDMAGGLLRAARECHAHGVFLWLLEEDESWAWEVPSMRSALASAGLPLHVMSRASWSALPAAADELSAFVASLAKQP